MSVAAGAAVPGALAVLPGTREPNVVVAHLAREESESSRNIIIDNSLLALGGEVSCELVRYEEEEERRWFTMHTMVGAHIHKMVVGNVGGARSEEEAEDLPAQMFSPGLLVVHDAPGGGHHHVAELSGGQQVRGPLLNVCDGNVEPALTCGIKMCGS